MTPWLPGDLWGRVLLFVTALNVVRAATSGDWSEVLGWVSAFIGWYFTLVAKEIFRGDEVPR